MAQYEMKNSVVNAWQWDGTVTGAQAIQAQFGDAQEMSFYQSAKAGSAPSLQIRDTKAFTNISAAPSSFVIMMGDGRSLQVMEGAAFNAQYSAKVADTAATAGPAGTANASPAPAAGSQGAASASSDAANASSPSTGSASPSP